MPTETQLRALRALRHKGLTYKQIAKLTCFTVKQLEKIFGKEVDNYNEKI